MLRPQPNRNLRVTRWVEWIVNRIPTMSYAKQQRMYWRIHDLEQNLDHLIEDYRKIMRNMPVANYRVTTTERDDVERMTKIKTTKVDFEPMSLSTAVRYKDLQDHPYGAREITMGIMKKHAKILADEHARDMEQKILEFNLQELNIETEPR